MMNSWNIKENLAIDLVYEKFKNLKPSDQKEFVENLLLTVGNAATSSLISYVENKKNYIHKALEVKEGDAVFLDLAGLYVSEERRLYFDKIKALTPDGFLISKVSKINPCNESCIRVIIPEYKSKFTEGNKITFQEDEVYTSYVRKPEF